MNPKYRANQPGPYTKHKAMAEFEALVKTVRDNRRHIKRLRKLGCSDQEIARALGIPIESLHFEAP